MNREQFFNHYIIDTLEYAEQKINSIQMDKITVEEKKKVFELLNKIGREVDRKEVLNNDR